MARQDDYYEGQRHAPRGRQSALGGSPRGRRNGPRPSAPKRPDASPMAAGARTGRFVRRVDEKGFGFLKDTLSDVDCFFHKSDYQPQAGDPTFEQLLVDAHAGQLMAFQAEQTDKGWRARLAVTTAADADDSF